MIIENPCKQRIKQLYLRRYRDLLKISQVQAIPVHNKTEHLITPCNLDNMDKLARLRSKSINPHRKRPQLEAAIDLSFDPMLKTPSRVYKANEMSEIIRKAQGCGLTYNSTDGAKQLHLNRQYFKNIRELQKTWHYENIRKMEEKRRFNLIPMEQHIQERLERKSFKLEEIVFEYPKPNCKKDSDQSYNRLQ